MLRQAAHCLRSSRRLERGPSPHRHRLASTLATATAAAMTTAELFRRYASVEIGRLRQSYGGDYRWLTGMLRIVKAAAAVYGEDVAAEVSRGVGWPQWLIAAARSTLRHAEAVPVA
jgi:hypothetical protein